MVERPRSRHGKYLHRLTEVDRAAMVRLYADGVKVQAIAHEFKCSDSYPARLARLAGLPARLSDARRRNMTAAAVKRAHEARHASA